jgi:protein ImuA
MSAVSLLHPHRAHAPQRSDVWAGDQLGEAGSKCFSTGHPPLDGELPDKGWPLDGMVELLQDRAEPHVWQLLLPALAEVAQQKAGPVVLVGAPLEPFGPSLAAQGLAHGKLLCIRAGRPAEKLWAAEQALRCADVAAVLAWLPQSRSAELRRLHMAAQQHEKLLFVFRSLKSRNDSSPARLRLVLEGVDAMNIHIIKRRGPPLDRPIVLAATNPRVTALLQSRRKSAGAPPATSIPTPQEAPHVLGRTAAIA